MNYRKKKWLREVNKAKKLYEKNTGLKHDYYSELNRRKRIYRKSRFNINLLIRLILFLICIYYLIQNIL